MENNRDFFEDNFVCPICGTDKMVIAHGPTKSPVLIVGEYPGDEEIKQGIPMVGNMSNILRTELAFLGFDFKSARRTNLWRHTPNKDKGCLQNGIEDVVREAKGRKAILLLGNEVADIFIGRSVMKVMGLNVTSNYFSAPLIMCCVNPAIAFHAGHGIGEIRLTLTKFITLLEKIKNVDTVPAVSSNNDTDDPWL